MRSVHILLCVARYRWCSRKAAVEEELQIGCSTISDGVSAARKDPRISTHPYTDRVCFQVCFQTYYHVCIQICVQSRPQVCPQICP